ncbi:Thioesterase family protein [Desulfonema limicola]|uniref:Thioesterase family protein n=1 Tax=Desulfonema limicola TaxID=45656 RepID=A0A975GFJ0_9BACT|nr:thioesterase family protein [Desulfonema limicola]QTA79288.1 Thioesterase family protein [Desulfonema limicola]
MARIKLELPEKFDYSTEITIRISDINYGRHLGNDSVLTLIHEARMRIFNSLGLLEKDENGQGLLIADAVVIYKSQGFYRDVLNIFITPDDPNKYGFDLLYKLVNKKTGIEIARAKTGIVFYDYQKNKVTGIPESFQKAFFSSKQ